MPLEKRTHHFGLWVWLAVVTSFWLLVDPLLEPTASAATTKQRSLDEWRTLTGPTAPVPRVFVRRDEVRFFFFSEEGVEAFSADWQRVRVPTQGYKVNTAMLHWRERLRRVPSGQTSWREATVIAGEEWRRLATNLIGQLTPRTPGRGAYFQAFLDDRLLDRDMNGQPKVAPRGEHPSQVTVERQFSMDETLERLARAVEEYLIRTHPHTDLFLLMAPNAQRFTQPLLLDRRRRSCVFLTPAALYDTTERPLNLSVTADGLSALLLESHGLALIKNPLSSVARLADRVFETFTRLAEIPFPKAGKAPDSPLRAPSDEVSFNRLDSSVETQVTTNYPAGSQNGIHPNPMAILHSPKDLDNRDAHLASRPGFALLGGRSFSDEEGISPGAQISPATKSGSATRGMNLEAWEAWLDRYTGTRREAGAMEILVDGEPFFRRFQQAIASATNHIHLNIYIFDKDDVAVDTADQLKRRSTEIDVKVLVDRMSTVAAGLSPPATPMREDFVPPTSIRGYLREDSRVQWRSFLNPWLSADHSKVLLVDGVTAWVGGMNLGREYRFEWHDLMFELRGPILASFEEEFDRSWAHAGLLGDAAYVAALVPGKAPAAPPPKPEPWIAIRRLPTKTGWKPFANAVLGALRRAGDYIYAENPYLFDKKVVAELVAARSRGVDVRVILPRVNDFKAGGRSNLVVANYLRARGVRVYFYPGMTHAKALLVDGWACVGSGNLNHLSLRLNQEANLGTSDPAFAARLKHEVFDADFSRSTELTQAISVDWMDFIADFVLEGL